MSGVGMHFWLSGGWAVDFHLGRVTRPHSDIDFVVKLNDRATLWGLLEREGAAHTRGDESGGVESFDLNDQTIEITYVQEEAEGIYVTPGFESWPWPMDSLTDDSVTLGDITVRAVSVAGLLDMKEGWEENFGEKPRAHDLADIDALRASLMFPD